MKILRLRPAQADAVFGIGGGVVISEDRDALAGGCGFECCRVHDEKIVGFPTFVKGSENPIGV